MQLGHFLLFAIPGLLFLKLQPTKARFSVPSRQVISLFYTLRRRPIFLQLVPGPVLARHGGDLLVAVEALGVGLVELFGDLLQLALLPRHGPALLVARPHLAPL